MTGIETPLAHSVRAWLENDMALYQEVERIAARDTRPVARVTTVRNMVADILYGMTGMSALRVLYRQTYGERQVPSWWALDKFRSGFTRAEFDAIDWDLLVSDLMEGMDNA